mmetsp:Transcript_9409/g.27633  ORF Transcript_9409/g.27633 Transcript_9409/m.27633 type:complete len:252 (+) Transcript_9409:916-1671(+)
MDLGQGVAPQRLRRGRGARRGARPAGGRRWRQWADHDLRMVPAPGLRRRRQPDPEPRPRGRPGDRPGRDGVRAAGVPQPRFHLRPAAHGDVRQRHGQPRQRRRDDAHAHQAAALRRADHRRRRAGGAGGPKRASHPALRRRGPGLPGCTAEPAHGVRRGHQRPREHDPERRRRRADAHGEPRRGRPWLGVRLLLPRRGWRRGGAHPRREHRGRHRGAEAGGGGAAAGAEAHRQGQRRDAGVRWLHRRRERR